MKKFFFVTSVVLAGAFLFETSHAGPHPVVAGKEFQLDLQELLKSMGPQKWTVLSDQNYGRRQNAGQLQVRRTQFEGRRVVAICHVPKQQQAQMRTSFEQEIDRQLKAAGAMQKGEVSVSHNQHTKKHGPAESTNITAPRLFFAIGNSHGFLDAGFYAHNGQIVLTVSYIQ